MIIKYLIVFVLILIVISLAAAMFSMVKDRSASKRTVKFLTIRIVLSISLFMLLIIGFLTGAIRPHGLMIPSATAPVTNTQAESPSTAPVSNTQAE